MPGRNSSHEGGEHGPRITALQGTASYNHQQRICPVWENWPPPCLISQKRNKPIKTHYIFSPIVSRGLTHCDTTCPEQPARHLVLLLSALLAIRPLYVCAIFLRQSCTVSVHCAGTHSFLLCFNNEHSLFLQKWNIALFCACKCQLESNA